MKKLSSCELFKASERNFQMGGDRMGGKGEVSRKRKGFTGLEAAIVLTAFVVVAAVFSYVVLNAGFFTTQKSKEVVHTGVEQATSSIELAGDVIGYGWIPYDNTSNITYDRSEVVQYKENSTALKTNGGSWNNLSIVKFYLQLTAGQHPVDLEGLVISYADEDTYVGNITYNKTANESAANMGDTGYLNMSMCEWTYKVITTSSYGDNDNLLELGEKAEITVTLPECGVGPNKEFKIEVKPASGATLEITRTTPSSIDLVMNLH